MIVLPIAPAERAERLTGRPSLSYCVKALPLTDGQSPHDGASRLPFDCTTHSASQIVCTLALPSSNSALGKSGRGTILEDFQ